MTLNRVDLPQPDGPITPTNSPGATVSETWSIAVSTPSGVSKHLTTSSTTRIAPVASVFAASASTRTDGAIAAAMAISSGTIRLARRGHPACLANPPIAHPVERQHDALGRNSVAAAAGFVDPTRGIRVLRCIPAIADVRSRGMHSHPTRASRLLELKRPAGAPAPILPCPINTVGAGALSDFVDFAGGQELDLAHVHRLFLQARVHLEIDGNVDRLPDILARYGGAVTAHEGGRPGADQLRQVAAHVHVLDQQSGVAEMVVRVPHRHVAPDRGAHMENGLDLPAGHAEWNDAFA